MMPKRGRITIQPDNEGSLIHYEIEVSVFAKYWLLFSGIVFCWLILPPIVVYRALNHHPGKLMRNLLQAV